MKIDTRDESAPGVATPGDEHQDLGVPLEGSARRRFGISVFVAVTLLAILVSVMPASLLRNDLLVVARPYLLGTGLDQNWGVFAPNPPRASVLAVARVVHADGSVVDYATPSSSGLSDYWNYRWRKYGDQIVGETGDRPQGRAFLRWAVDQDRRAGGVPARVVLVVRSSANLPPGPGPDTGPWRETSVFSAQVDGR